MTDNEYKELSVKEFARAARVYETDRGGVYKMCKKDYPDVLSELEKESFTDLLDCGCGPAPMLRALKQYADGHDIECWLSMEEKMACGIGACLSCVCRSTEVDAHSQVKNKRVCTEGPVFRSTEIELGN